MNSKLHICPLFSYLGVKHGLISFHRYTTQMKAGNFHTKPDKQNSKSLRYDKTLPPVLRMLLFVFRHSYIFFQQPLTVSYQELIQLLLKRFLNTHCCKLLQKIISMKKLESSPCFFNNSDNFLLINISQASYLNLLISSELLFSTTQTTTSQQGFFGTCDTKERTANKSKGWILFPIFYV